MKQPSFLKNITLRVVFTIPLRFRGLIVLPILTRLYPQDIYGAWLQILLFKDVLSNLLSLQLGAALVRYLSAEKDPKYTIKAVFMVTLVCSLCFILLVWIFSDGTSQLIFGRTDLRSILIVASIWMLINACMRVGLSVLRSRETIGILSSRELLSALWLVFSVYVSYLMKLEIERLMLICLIGDVILLIWIFVQIDIFPPLISPLKGIVEVKKFLLFTTPLIFGSLFLWLTRSIDRFLIVHFHGLPSVGSYGVAFQVASLLFIVLGPINFVLFPRASHAWNQGKKDDVNRNFSQAVTLTLASSIPLVVGILATSDGIIKLLAGESYLSTKSLIFWLLVSCVASMIYQNHLFVIHLVEKTYVLPVLFICTAILNLIAGYLFVSKAGVLGAAVARALALITMAVVITVWARYHIRFRIGWNLIARVGLASLIMGLAINWMPMDSWGSLLTKIFAGGVIFLSLLFLLRVVSKEKLIKLKNQF